MTVGARPTGYSFSVTTSGSDVGNRFKDPVVEVSGESDVVGIGVASADVDSLTIVGWLRLEDQYLDPSRGLDAAILAYRRWGIHCPAHLDGDFSFALLDRDKGLVLLARDRLGVKPLFYSSAGGVLLVASSLALMPSDVVSSSAVDSRWLAEYLAAMSIDWKRTPYLGVEKLEPGTMAVFDREGLHTSRYHQFSTESQWQGTHNEQWVGRYRRTFDHAVASRLPSFGSFGAESSGGLDSSSVLATIASLDANAPTRMHAFGNAFNSDEPGLISGLSLTLGVGATHLQTAPAGAQSNSADLQRMATRFLGMPSEHGDSFGHLHFYDLCKHFSIHRLFSGFGGDQVASNHAEEFALEAATHGGWRARLRARQGGFTSQTRLLFRNARNSTPSVSGSPDELRDAIALQALLNRDVVEAYGLVDRATAMAQTRSESRTINEQILKFWLGPLVATRASENSQAAAIWGVEYVFPFLDQRLIEQYLRTPTIYKWGQGAGRYLHRSAMVGRLPDQIRLQPRKDTGVLVNSPHLHRRFVEHLRLTAASLVDNPHPLSADLIDIPRLRSSVTAISEKERTPAMMRLAINLERATALNDWLRWLDERSTQRA